MRVFQPHALPWVFREAAERFQKARLVIKEILETERVRALPLKENCDGAVMRTHCFSYKFSFSNPSSPPSLSIPFSSGLCERARNHHQALSPHNAPKSWNSLYGEGQCMGVASVDAQNSLETPVKHFVYPPPPPHHTLYIYLFFVLFSPVFLICTVLERRCDFQQYRATIIVPRQVPGRLGAGIRDGCGRLF